MYSRREFGDNEEGDVVYFELRRQVLLLISEDNEETQEEKQQKSRVIPRYGVQPERFFNWTGINSDDVNSVPEWLSKLWRKTGNSTGTGVFIPLLFPAPVRDIAIIPGGRRMQEGKCSNP